jgi:hypothetical protein
MKYISLVPGISKHCPKEDIYVNIASESGVWFELSGLLGMHGQCTRVNVVLFTLTRRRMYSTAFCTCLSSSYPIASSWCDASREGWSAAGVSLDRHDSSSHLTVSLILPSTRRHRPTNKHSSDVSLILHLCPHSNTTSRRAAIEFSSAAYAN